jgi:RimJ/RimL family protein N-acetyltransferase
MLSDSPRGLCVRTTVSDDFEALLTMKSDADEVKWSGFAGPPKPEMFRQWFDRAMRDPERVMFTGLIGDLVRAYIHYHRLDTVTFGVSTGIAVEFRGQGYGTALRRRAADLLHADFPDVAIEAWLAEGNVASQRSWAKMGYRPTDVTVERQFYFPSRNETVRRWRQSGAH